VSNDAAPAEPRRRRRRRRPKRTDDARTVAAVPAEPAPPPTAAQPAADKPARKRRAPRDAGTERGLRDLVGAGKSQLGVSGALRARDVNRPTEEDLAAAERDTVIVRRNWKPTNPAS
jgi:hypothetical protein